MSESLLRIKTDFIAYSCMPYVGMAPYIIAKRITEVPDCQVAKMGKSSIF